MDNTKENLEVQRYEMNDILGALMCMDDKEVQENLLKNRTCANLQQTLNSKEIYEGTIAFFEEQIRLYEQAVKGLRELADILQVPKNFEG